MTLSDSAASRVPSSTRSSSFAPGLGQRPMFAAYVLTITDGQDMQKRNRLRPVAVTAGGAERAGAEAPVSSRQ